MFIAQIVHDSVSNLYIFFKGAIAASDSFFTDTWPVAIVQLNCTGQEKSLSDCMHLAASATNLCPSSHDSSVICQSMIISP